MMIVFMTDGQPTVGESNPGYHFSLHANPKATGIRMFNFGVGSDVNTQAPCDLLADQSRGYAQYVLPNENLVNCR